MRNNVNAERVTLDLINSQRGSGKSDRSFRRDEILLVGWDAKGEAFGVTLFPDVSDFCHAIDMAAHNMATKLVTDLQSTFQID